MKISVISPVYNVEDYLRYCIESVLQQTHGDFELILIDDGSTDSSGKICDQYSARYPEYIETIHTTNSGPFRARLIGIQQAHGDVLVFLDSDDCLRKDALEQIVRCFDEHACDMVLFDTGECAPFSTKQIKHALKGGEAFSGTAKGVLCKKIILGQVPNSVCLKAVKANCKEIPEHFFRFNAKHGEDLLLSVHFITNCNKIVYLNEGLYHYRIRPGSAVHSFDIQRKESIKTVHTELEKYIEKWNIPELKPLHNARKVRGWIEDLKLLLKHRSTLSNGVFCDQLRSMATDPYFRNAYNGMDSSRLSRADRILAFCLMKKQYFLLRSASHVLNMRKK